MTNSVGTIPLLRRIASIALVAGCCAGIVLTAVHQVWLAPLIDQAEVIEAKFIKAEQTAPGGKTPSHDESSPDASLADASDRSDWGRLAQRVFSQILLGVGFGLVLVSAMLLRKHAKDTEGIPAGLLWGLAGFTAFSLAPSLGLPPQLPGVPHAPVGPRQLWWISTAVTTACGLAVLAFAPPKVKAVGAALILLPHLADPPPTPESSYVLPPDLPARFSATVLVASALFWAVLGGVAGWMNGRFKPHQDRESRT